MKSKDQTIAIERQRLENGGLILFVVLITIGLGLVVKTFLGALLWSALAAILFQPLFQRLLARWPDRRNRAALVTLLIITVAVVIPALIVGSMVVDQAAGVYSQIRSDQLRVLFRTDPRRVAWPLAAIARQQRVRQL
jgi:predicted PurR-regulated permease PerM